MSVPRKQLFLLTVVLFAAGALIGYSLTYLLN